MDPKQRSHRSQEEYWRDRTLIGNVRSGNRLDREAPWSGDLRRSNLRREVERWRDGHEKRGRQFGLDLPGPRE